MTLDLRNISCLWVFFFGHWPQRYCDDETLIYLKKLFSKNQGFVPLGGSGLGFVIQDHTDHGASKERSFRVPSFGRVRIRICDPRSHRSRCMKTTEFLDELSGNFKKSTILRLVYARGLLSSSLDGSSNCTTFFHREHGQKYAKSDF